MKLKRKLPLLFLLTFVLITGSVVAYIKLFAIKDILSIENGLKEKYTGEDLKLADRVSALYPDYKSIGDYLQQISEKEEISIKLYNRDLSNQIMAYLNANRSLVSSDQWVPVKTSDNRLVFFMDIKRPLLRESILSHRLSYQNVTSFILMLIAVFLLLTMYFHYNITKPIQALNTRLKSVGMGRGESLNSLQLKATRRNDEIGELYKQFNDMEKKLYFARKEQIDMIAAIAHDLKTPLTTINGFVELLLLKELPEGEKKEYYELILKKSNYITEIINGFSAFTKDELELETTEKKPVEALKLFEDIAAEYETELSGLDSALVWNHSFNPNQYVWINEPMLRRVFGNLFSNVVRYAGENELKVYMSGYTQDHYAYFQVEDNGRGVPEKDLSYLFLKFFTVDKSRQSKSGGTGLGLASCKSIIEHHGGEISAFQSSYGGLGIRFTLPLVDT